MGNRKNEKRILKWLEQATFDKTEPRSDAFPEVEDLPRQGTTSDDIISPQIRRGKIRRLVFATNLILIAMLIAGGGYAILHSIFNNPIFEGPQTRPDGTTANTSESMQMSQGTTATTTSTIRVMPTPTPSPTPEPIVYHEVIPWSEYSDAAIQQEQIQFPEVAGTNKYVITQVDFEMNLYMSSWYHELGLIPQGDNDYSNHLGIFNVPESLYTPFAQASDELHTATFLAVSESYIVWADSQYSVMSPLLSEHAVIHVYVRATGADLAFTMPIIDGERSLAPLTPGLLIEDAYYFEFCSAMHGATGSEYELYKFDISARKLEIVAYNAIHPFLYHDTLSWFQLNGISVSESLATPMTHAGVISDLPAVTLIQARSSTILQSVMLMYDSRERNMGRYWFHVIREGVTTSIAADVKNPSFWPHSDGRYVLLEDYENMDHKMLYDIERDFLVDIDMPEKVSFLGFAGNNMIFQTEDDRSFESGWYSTPADYDSTLYKMDLP